MKERCSTFVFASLKQPTFEALNGTKYSAETVARSDDYLTRIRLEKAAYLTKMQSLFSYAIFSPKPWKELAADAYYKNEGKFKEGETYWKSGELPITESILKIKELPAKTKSDVLNAIEELICNENSAWNWNIDAHKHLLIKEHLPPKYLKEHQSKIIREMNEIYRLWQSSAASWHPILYYYQRRGGNSQNLLE